MQLRRSEWRLPQNGIQRPCVEGQGRCEQGHAYSEIGRRHISEAERYRSEGAGRLSKSLPFYPQNPLEGAAARLQAMAVASQGAKAAPPSRGPPTMEARKRFLGTTVATQNHIHKYVHMLYLHDDVA